MHPIFYLLSVSDSIHYPRVGKKGSRTFARLSQCLLQIPGCVPPVRMRVSPELFEYVQATPGWHLQIALRLHQHIALICGCEVAERWLHSLTERSEAGLVLGAPAAKEVSHG